MLSTYTLAFSLVTLVTEASVVSDCMKFLVDDEFHVPCANIPLTSRQPCLVSTTEDHDYLQRYGIVSDPGSSTGDMICGPKDAGNDVDWVSTKLHRSKTIEWMWTPWATSTTSGVTTTSRTMYFTDSGSVKECPYRDTSSYIVLLYACDDSGKAFADGVLVHTTRGSNKERTVHIKPTTRLLAFEVLNNYGSFTGVRAWVSTGVISDTSSAWRCSLVYEAGWNQLGFDDSHWGGVDRQYYNTKFVGHGAATIGCGSKELGPFYFRRMLTV